MLISCIKPNYSQTKYLQFNHVLEYHYELDISHFFTAFQSTFMTINLTVVYNNNERTRRFTLTDTFHIDILIFTKIMLQSLHFKTKYNHNDHR